MIAVITSVRFGSKSVFRFFFGTPRLISYILVFYLIGPENYDMAAICFYKALKVYPAPAELVMVYQKTIPQEVFTLVMGMLSMDVRGLI